jgi:ribonuclease J
LVWLAPGPAEIIDHVPAGRLARDGDGVVPVDGASLRERRKLLWKLRGGPAWSTEVAGRRRRKCPARHRRRGGELTNAIARPRGDVAD